MNRPLHFLLPLLAALFLTVAQAQGDLEINTPAIAQLKASMSARHAQLKPWLDAGAVGLTRDGNVALRDANLVPLAQRQAVNALIAAENNDRGALYREIARANGNPAWEADIRATFGQRWAERAAPGWFIQNASGAWQQK